MNESLDFSCTTWTGKHLINDNFDKPESLSAESWVLPMQPIGIHVSRRDYEDDLQAIASLDGSYYTSQASVNES